MNELSDDLYNAILSDMENGDDAMEEQDYAVALSFYQQALEKIPEKKEDWEIALHVYTALGDCYFKLNEYEQSVYNYHRAHECPDGTGNGYVWLGAGKAYYEMEEKDKAKNALMSAYMLEGKGIFSGEDRKYFMLIKELV